MQGGVKGKRRNGKRKRIMQKHVKIKAENCFLKKKKKKKGGGGRICHNLAHCPTRATLSSGKQFDLVQFTRRPPSHCRTLSFPSCIQQQNSSLVTSILKITKIFPELTKAHLCSINKTSSSKWMKASDIDLILSTWKHSHKLHI
jgi:hypothetical protein